jgi:hypothetical protein
MFITIRLINLKLLYFVVDIHRCYMVGLYQINSSVELLENWRNGRE